MAVTMTNLYVENEDFYFDGDLRLLGKTRFKNASLIVTGNLVFAIEEAGEDGEDGEQLNPTLEIINGNLCAGNLWTENSSGMNGSDYDDICEYFEIINGNIHITSGSFDIANSNIYAVDDIIVENGDLICGEILKSNSIFVYNNICSGSIYTTSDLFCTNGEFYGDIYCDGSMYVEETCNLGEDNNLFVNISFECNSLCSTGTIKIGK